MTKFLSLLVLIYVVYVAGIYLLQRKLIYFPPKQDLTQAAFDNYTPVTLNTEDGLTLRAWYHQPAQAGSPVLVIFQGNAASFRFTAPLYDPYVKANYGVLVVIYRGYDGNPGKPTEQGLYHDGRGAIDYLIKQAISPKQMVLYGDSLGSAVAVQLASELAVGAVVLVSPFSSLTANAAHHYPLLPVGALLKDKFDSHHKIGENRAPLLIIHGQKDRITPVALGKKLYEAANEPKQFIVYPEGTHNTLYNFNITKDVMDFVDRSVKQRKPN